MLLTVTPAGVEVLRRDVAELGEPGYCFRVTVVGGGNSGLQFGFDVEPSRPDDVVLVFEGLTVVVDPSSAGYLKGYTIDAADGGFFRLIAPS